MTGSIDEPRGSSSQRTTVSEWQPGRSASFEAISNRAFSKISQRMLPLLFAGLIIANLDRLNVSYVKVQLESDLGLSNVVYGAGASIFFIGYILAEVPSNMLLHKVGPRIWLARIMITWGIIGAAMMFVVDDFTFYVLRFLLGVAEAGFIPGVLVLISQWYPARRRGIANAVFFTATPLSGVIGGPLAAWILPLDGVANLHGWQWLFVVEGISAVLLGIVFLAFIRNSPSGATWLTDEEREAVLGQLAQEPLTGRGHFLRDVVRDKRVFYLGATYILVVLGVSGVSFWSPQLIMNSGISSTITAAWLSALPWLAATVAIVVVAHNSDRTGDRKWHLVGLSAMAAVGWVMTTMLADNTVLALVGLSLAAAGGTAAVPLLLGMPARFMSAMALAAGVALVHALGNIGTALSPFFIGVVTEASGSPTGALWWIAGAAACAAISVALWLPKELARDPKARL